MKNIFSLVFFTIIYSFLSSCSKGNTSDDWQEENFNGQVKSVITSKYKAEDREGNLEIGEKISRFSDKFDENGNKIESAYYYMNYLVSKQSFTYDNNARLVEINRYNLYNDLTSKTTFEYNADGKKSKRHYIDKDGEKKSTTTYIYDNGHLIEEQRVSTNGDQQLTTYTAITDEAGVAGKIQYYDQGKLTRKRKHDRKGNLVELTLNKVVDDGLAIIEEVSTYTYEYNNQQDWINQIELVNGTPKTISRRDITYYEN